LERRDASIDGYLDIEANRENVGEVVVAMLLKDRCQSTTTWFRRMD
jgi:hypothetical protein